MRSLFLVALSVMTAPTFALATQYTRVAVVTQGGSEGGGDFGSPFEALNALNAPESWCAAPTKASPCLIKVMPGLYDIGTSLLTMKAYVDIEGSGEGVTTIRGGGSNGIYGLVRFILGATSELRSLTLEQVSGTYGISVESGSLARITSVTVVASGGTSPSNRTTLSVSGSAMLDRVTITASGYGPNYALNVHAGGSVTLQHCALVATGLNGQEANALINRGSALIQDSTIRSGGFYSAIRNYSSLTLRGVNVEGSQEALRNQIDGSLKGNARIEYSQLTGPSAALIAEPQTTAYIGASQLAGYVWSGSGMGLTTCGASYDGAFLALGPTCKR